MNICEGINNTKPMTARRGPNRARLTVVKEPIVFHVRMRENPELPGLIPHYFVAERSREPEPACWILGRKLKIKQKKTN